MFRPPKGTSLSGTTRFEPSLVQIGRTVRPVAFPNQKKEKKRWQTGYSPRPPTSPYRSQSLHAGWPPVNSSIFQVLLKSVQWFCRCGWSKIALPHYFGHWLIQQLVLRTAQSVISVCSKSNPLSSFHLRLRPIITHTRHSGSPTSSCNSRTKQHTNLDHVYA